MQRFLILAFCLLLPNLRAQEIPKTPAAVPAPHVEKFEKQFNFYPGGKIQVLCTVPGDLKIIGWNKGSVRLEAERIVYYLPQEDAKALLQKSPIRVRYDQTSATIQTTGSPSPPATMEINLTLYVPGEKTDLNIQMSRGDLSIDSVKGEVEAGIVEGSLDAKSIAGYFSCKTRRGDIHVEMSGKRWEGYEFAAMTQRGSAELILPREYSAALQLETRDGAVVVNYPPGEVDGEAVQPAVIVKKKSQIVRTSVGEGGAPIRLTTYSGNLTLALKE
jgi:hypothetical protein